MIFIWRGRGYLALLSIIAYGLLGGLINGGLQKLGVSFPIEPIAGVILSSPIFIALWVYGKRWNSTNQTLVDKSTGREFVLKNRHTLFWIPMQYWAIIWPIIILLNFNSFIK